MTTSRVQSRLDGQVLHVTLNRPEKRNALTPQMLYDLAAAVREVDRQPAVRAIIVAAEGPIFSAGIDLMSLAEAQGASEGRNAGRWLRRFAEELQHALDLIEATEVPVIGALQGQVLGLGLELALAFDLRVATSDLTLSIPESRIGLVADVGGTTRLARTIGPSRAKDMLLTSRSVDAHEALAWGLVNRVVPPPMRRWPWAWPSSSSIRATALTNALKWPSNAGPKVSSSPPATCRRPFWPSCKNAPPTSKASSTSVHRFP
jgi:enoyl-CoA hydratase/carnithine racemase